MRGVLLGTGSPPPNPKRRGPATLLSLGDERFLVHTIDLGHPLTARWITSSRSGDVEVRRSHRHERRPAFSGDTRPCENLVRWSQ